MSDKGRGTATHMVCMLAVVFLMFPVLWAMLASFRTPGDLYDANPLISHPTLANYRIALNAFPLARLLINTILMAAGVTAGQVLIAILAGYGFVAFRFRGRQALFAAVTLAILVPQQCLIIPSYIFVARLGWTNSYLGLVVPLIGASAFAVMLLKQHIGALPGSLFEAAALDGAKHRETLWRVVVPAVRPAIAALAVLVFVTNWNEYLWPLLVASERDQTTIQVGLQLFQTQEGSQYGPMMAAATLATVPVLLAYLLNQRRVTDAFLRAGVR